MKSNLQTVVSLPYLERPQPRLSRVSNLCPVLTQDGQESSTFRNNYWEMNSRLCSATRSKKRTFPLLGLVFSLLFPVDPSHSMQKSRHIDIWSSLAWYMYMFASLCLSTLPRLLHPFFYCGKLCIFRIAFISFNLHFILAWVFNVVQSHS